MATIKGVTPKAGQAVLLQQVNIAPDLDLGNTLPRTNTSGVSMITTLEPGHLVPAAEGSYRYYVILETATQRVISAQVTVQVTTNGGIHPMTMGIDPVSAVTLTTSPASPISNPNTSVTLTGNPTDGISVEYKFEAKLGSGSWTTLRDFNTTATYNWTPGTSGYYRLKVTAREAGTTSPTYTHEIPFYVGYSPLSALSVTLNPASPQSSPSQTTISASATGGAGVEYQFMVKERSAGSFTTVASYSTTTSCTWTPPTNNTYYDMQVYAREAGSPSAYDVAKIVPLYVGSVTAYSIVTVTANPASPQAPNTNIVLTATPTGGINLEYRFWQLRNGAWTLLRDFNTSQTYTWTPTQTGDYTISVHAREVGSTIGYLSSTGGLYYGIRTSPITGVTLTPSPASPQPVNTPITLTATATGGTTPQYKFFVKRAGNAWQTQQDYSTTSTCTWTPSIADYYRLRVYVRESGSSMDYDQMAETTYYVGTTPLTGVTLTANPSACTPNTAVTLTATPTGGAAPRYVFYVNTDKLNDLSTSNTCAWTPTATGTYYLSVFVRETGNDSGPIDAMGSLTYYVSQAPTVSLTTPAPNVTLTAPANLQLAATASDPDGTVSKVEFYAGTTKLGEDLGAPYRCLWNNIAAGTYNLTAVATDNSGVKTTSSAVTLTVTDHVASRTVGVTADSYVQDTAETQNFGTAELIIVNPSSSNCIRQSYLRFGLSTLTAPVAEAKLILFPLDLTGTGVTNQLGNVVDQTWGETTVTWANKPTADAPATSWGSMVIGQPVEVDVTALVRSAYANEQTAWSTCLSALSSAYAVAYAAKEYSTEAWRPQLRIWDGQALSVTLTAPSNNATLLPTSTITLAATASDPDSVIAKVEFYDGTTLIGEDTSAPYSFEWTDASVASHTLTAKVVDIAGLSATSDPVTILVDSPPVAADDVLTIQEDPPYPESCFVLNNDYDPDIDDTLHVTAVTDGEHGSVAIASNGHHVTYTPDENWNGVDTFTYTITDSHGRSDTATVAVTVSPVNDYPVAENDTATTDEDTLVDIDVLANDSDPVEGDTVVIQWVGTPQSGASVDVVNGKIRYTPMANWNGQESFSYSIIDEQGGTALAVVSITVSAINDPPTATDNTPTTPEDVEIRIPVATDDTDPDNGDVLTVVQVTPAGHGTVTIHPDGDSVVYTPAPNYHGPDSFDYVVSDGHGGTDTATVYVTVTPVNDLPVTVDDVATINEDTTIDVDVLANDTDIDGDLLTIATVFTTDGSATIVNGKVRYTPPVNWRGDATVSYSVEDGHGGSWPGTLTVHVLENNQAPYVSDLTLTTDEDVPLAITLSATETNPEDRPTFTIESWPTHGTLLVRKARLTYIPNANWSGQDSFTYRANDNSGASNALSAIATVTITVSSVDDPPTVHITSPLPNTTTTAPATLTLTAVAADVDSTITQVQFFVNGTAQGNPLLTAPFTLPWADVAAGTYTITAAATSNGVTTTSAPILLAVTPPSSGHVLHYSYDYTNLFSGELVQIQEEGNNLLRTPTTLTYDPDTGAVLTVTTPKPGSTTGETVTATATYTDLGNLATISGPGNNANSTLGVSFYYEVDTGYSQAEALGQPIVIVDNLAHATHLRYNTRGQTVSVTDPVGITVTGAYDDLGQLTNIYYPATGQQGPYASRLHYTYSYNGGPVKTVELFDESGSTTPFRIAGRTFGEEGEVLEETGNGEAKTYTYDALYRLSRVQDGKGQSTIYGYDLCGRLVSVAMPGYTQGTNQDLYCVNQFDAAGRVLETVDGNSVITHYTYDHPEGLLTQVTSTGAGETDVTLTYDDFARVSSVTDGTGTRAVTYDDGGLPLTVNTTYTDLPTRTIGYSYYPDGSRAGMTVPLRTGPGDFTYSYDRVGRLVSMTNPFDQTTTWEYNDNDTLAQRTLANGAFSTMGYNALGSLLSMVNYGSDNSIRSQFSDMHYDGLQKLTQLTQAIPSLPGYSGTRAFQYNDSGLAMGALTLETFVPEAHTPAYETGYFQEFAYDAAGNPTTFRGVEKAYNINNQHFGAGMAYDGNGNPTTYKGQSLTFDANNQLTAYSTLLTAGYQAGGLRAWKESGGGRRYFLYDGITPVCELDEDGVTVAVNTFGADGLVSRTLDGATSTDTRYYQFTPNGDVAHRTDDDDTLLASDMYDGYGGLVISKTPAGQDYDFADDPYGYKGQAGYYTDHETGLILCTFRYYDPETGRWLTRDPIGYAGGMNLYGYCGGDGVNEADPSGLDWLDNWANFCAGVGDSMTFGITDFVRQKIGCNDVINHSGGYYIAGEVTETVVEIALTCGSGALKKAAANSILYNFVRNQGNKIIAAAGKRGIGRITAFHHDLYLKGHPGNPAGLFPATAILYKYPKLHLLGRIMKVAEHTKVHKYINKIEKIYKWYYINPVMIERRILADLARHAYWEYASLYEKYSTETNDLYYDDTFDQGVSRCEDY
jgi:RHS repeat-associated protein